MEDARFRSCNASSTLASVAIMLVARNPYMNETTPKEITQEIVSNQIAIEAIFVKSHNLHSGSEPMSATDMDELRTEIAPLMSQAMSELGYTIVKTTEAQ
jgi:hypothetical protein